MASHSECNERGALARGTARATSPTRSPLPRLASPVSRAGLGPYLAPKARNKEEGGEGTRAPGYESPWRKLAVLVTLERKNKRQRHPRGATPHSWRTRGAEAERGLGPGPGPVTRDPQEGRGVYGREKRKREITVSYSSQFASGSTKARKYATALREL